jgi:hypothetical protein
MDQSTAHGVIISCQLLSCKRYDLLEKHANMLAASWRRASYSSRKPAGMLALVLDSTIACSSSAELTKRTHDAPLYSAAFASLNRCYASVMCML